MVGDDRMTIEEVNSYAKDNEVDLVVFSNPDFDDSIIGISSDDRVIYDYDLMVEELMRKDKISETDAIEFIDYNTLRSLSYVVNSPIILQIKQY